MVAWKHNLICGCCFCQLIFVQKKENPKSFADKAHVIVGIEKDPLFSIPRDQPLEVTSSYVEIG